ncbi:putative cupin superfamily protein [Archangium gephyra]|uniref:Cupin 2 barrel domain protein n=1 Tax=Archangium gephyra TaxID=48 RepID=A0AAC8QFZ2_9BACT|nr:cupin domain-containing protein [Archangium gephyra]AKJ06440.1 Cupin 2 barrel domain protein [Archangium gephyra]REG32248.1 putative cupin superfamily protein [Archangium gephyra]
MSEKKPTASSSPLSRAADRTRATEQSQQHPLNPNSEVHGHSLSELVGMRRTGVHLLRIPPGKESFIFHSHQLEEEWMYVLSGRGIAEIDDTQHEVGPGDFLGFAAPSVGHHLRNPFSEDLVYLSGGERREMEVADFPRHNKRMIRVGGTLSFCPLDQLETITLPDSKD